MNRISIGSKIIAAARLTAPFAIADDHFVVTAKDSAMAAGSPTSSRPPSAPFGVEKCSVPTLQAFFSQASMLSVKADELAPPSQIQLPTTPQPPIPQSAEEVEEAPMPNMNEFKENSSPQPSTLDKTSIHSDFTFCMLAQQRGHQGANGSSKEPFQNQAIMHVVRRTPKDFVPNNMIYHRLGKNLSVYHNNKFAVRALQQDAVNGDNCAEEVVKVQQVIADELAPEATIYNRMVQKAYERTGILDGTCVFWPHECDAGNTIAHINNKFMVLVNLKPIVPLHLLVVPLRAVSSISHLTSDELEGLGESVWMALRALEEADPTADGFSIGIQQGAGAGQSVPHLHCHVIPFHADSKLAGEPEDELHDTRAARTPEVMRAESEMLRPLFAKAEELLKQQQ